MGMNITIDYMVTTKNDWERFKNGELFINLHGYTFEDKETFDKAYNKYKEEYLDYMREDYPEYVLDEDECKYEYTIDQDILNYTMWQNMEKDFPEEVELINVDDDKLVLVVARYW